MRKYRANAASPTRVDYGWELSEGLLGFDETTAMSPLILTVTDDLFASFLARLGKRKDQVTTRAKLRVAEYYAELDVRGLHAALKKADGMRVGPLTESIFEKGLLEPVVAPSGARQLKPLQDILGKLKESKNAALADIKKEYVPKLEAVADKLAAAIVGRDGAANGYADLFRKERALRDEHLITVDKIIGLVRAAFPNDRARQDAVFPEFVDEDEPEEPEPKS